MSAGPHYPISDGDAAAIELFLTAEGARQHSRSGGEIEYLQTFGTAALEDYQDKRAANNRLRHDLENAERFRNELLGMHLTGDENSVRAERMADVEHLAGRSIAAQPWNLLAPTAQPRSEGPYGDAYHEPGYEQEAKRAFVSRRRRRMAEVGAYGHWRVLETYFGTIGRQFEEQPLPRLFSLLHLVKPGRELLNATQRLLKRDGTVPDRMRWTCCVIDQDKYAPHRETFERGVIAVERLYREAAQSWVSSRGGR